MVLAAGAGHRFGGRKLEARIGGRPILQHVLDALATAGHENPVVVVPADRGLESAVAWRHAERVVNPAPERGLSSSLRLGWAAAMATEPAPDAILVVLADQPALRPEIVQILASVPLDPAAPIVAPRYTGSGDRNPVRIERSAAALVEQASGDRGLGPLLDASPGLVRWIDVPGDNPDVDRRPDLVAAIEARWASRVRDNREQVDRLREAPDTSDFYAAVSSIFRDDPDRVGDPVLDALRRHARPGDIWLDIGAGAGRYALPMARTVGRVIALDASPSMLGALRESMREHGIENVEVVDGRWPAAAASAVPADVSLIAHVGYDIEAIGPFVDAMEGATRRQCLAVMMERSPASLAEAFWPPIHGEPRIALPALPAFVELLEARGRAPDVEMVESSRRRWAGRVELEAFARRQTWVEPGTAKDRRLQALLDEWLVVAADGTVDLSVAEPLRIGLIAWSPR